MDFSKLRQTYKQVLSENQLHRVANIGFAVAVTVLAYAAFSKSPVVVMTPPNLTEAVTISKTKADPAYLKSWAFALAQTLGNVTPQNADFVKSGVLPFVAPSIYQDVLAALNEQVMQIQLDRVAISFSPREVIWEPETGKVFVPGQSITTGTMGKDDTSLRTYEFIIKVSNYAPVVTHLVTYRGEARTLKAIDRLRRAGKLPAELADKKNPAATPTEPAAAPAKETR